MNTRSSDKEIKVWDPLIRIFHWTLVIGFTVAYLTGDELITIHIWSGYLIVGLLLIRLLWGFIGTKHARFKDFIYPPPEVVTSLKSLVSGKPRRYLGHNPAGGVMVLLLLASLMLTTGSGLVMLQNTQGSLFPPPVSQSGWFADDDDEFEGSEVLEEVHEFFANLTLLLVFLHIAGVVVSSRLHHENLVRAMITGKKPLHPKE
jgi:cytochrome b